MDLENVKLEIGNWISTFQNKELEKCYISILNDINTLQEDKKPENIDVTLDKVKSEIRKISQDIIHGYIRDDHSNFVQAFIYLVYNWNNNTVKDIDVDIICSFIGCIITSNKTMNIARETMQETTQHLLDIKSWRPPAINISKEYLKSLLK